MNSLSRELTPYQAKHVFSALRNNTADAEAIYFDRQKSCWKLTSRQNALDFAPADELLLRKSFDDVPNTSREIGRGAFGFVIACEDASSGRTVAIKRELLTARLLRVHSDICGWIDHPNIVKHLGLEIGTQNRAYVVMELVGEGKSLYGESLDESLLLHYVKQLIDALVYLHDRGVVHRDIKAANIILCSDTRNLKLVDFGAAQLLDLNVDADEEFVGTPFWMSPESLRGEVVSTSATDIWSLGCTIIELASGRSPWHLEPRIESLDPYRALVLIANMDWAIPPPPLNLSDLARDFISSCTVRNASSRPKARELLNHPWIAPKQVL